MKGQKVANPKLFLNEVQSLAKKKRNFNFAGYQQNDAEEFILFLFENIHDMVKIEVEMKIKGTAMNALDEMAKKCYARFIDIHRNDYSLFVKLFYFMTVTTNKCIQTNRHVSESYQSNFILDIPIPKKNGECTLENCIDYYFKPVKFEGDNALFDESKKEKVNCIQTTQIWNLPEILIITLKRFSYDGRKNKTLVRFSCDTINMNNYVCGYNRIYSYELYGVCNHSGGVSGGHYTSFVKHNTSWYHYNDTSVGHVKSHEHIVTPMAYCLFYRRIR